MMRSTEKNKRSFIMVTSDSSEELKWRYYYDDRENGRKGEWGDMIKWILYNFTSNREIAGVHPTCFFCPSVQMGYFRCLSKSVVKGILLSSEREKRWGMRQGVFMTCVFHFSLATPTYYLSLFLSLSFYLPVWIIRIYFCPSCHVQVEEGDMVWSANKIKYDLECLCVLCKLV